MKTRRSTGAISASFDSTDEYVPRDAGKRPELMGIGVLPSARVATACILEVAGG